MKTAVILARVSTMAQDFDRQVDELKYYYFDMVFHMKSYIFEALLRFKEQNVRFTTTDC